MHPFRAPFQAQSRARFFSFGSAPVLKAGRTAVAGLLCVLMVETPLWAAPPATPPTAKKPAAAQMQGDQRVLHALNRLTFGPRPGDVAAVRAMGLNRWFEMQLNPESIDDSKLEARLRDFPAMQMSVEELNKRFPGPQAIKQMEAGKVDLPSDPTARAIALDEIALYKVQRKKQEGVAAAAKQAGSAQVDASMNGAPGDMAGGPPMAPPPAGNKGRRRAAANAAPANAMDAGNTMGAEADAMTAAPKPLAANEIAPEGMGGETAEAYPRDAAMRILSLAPDQRMKAVLALPVSELVRFRQSLKPRDLAQLVNGLTPIEKETLTALGGGLRVVGTETLQSRMLRDVYSDRQLEAVMTDFWLNHFNVYVRKSQVEPYLIPTYERETIRPNALGNFEKLLVATAQSPAMLVYLDNWRSTGPDSPQAGRIKQAQMRRPGAPGLKLASAGLNENYGRELMELHTVGVGSGYTQADVTQVAKVFTGWTIDKPYQGGTATFDERRHEPGTKTVLGQEIRENGQKEGMEVLHILATSPATAHFISQKLAIRFVADVPAPALVDRMAASFTASHGDIKTVLRTMFASPEFWATSAERAKVKTPQEFVVSAVRASGLEVTNAAPLVQSLDKLGMPLYGMQTPNGYSWLQDGWVSTGALVSRMNFALVMSAGRLPGTRTEWSTLLADATPTVVKAAYDPAGAPNVLKEQKLESILLGSPVSERTRQTVLSQAGDSTVAEQAATEFDLQGGPGGKKGARYGAGRGFGPNAPAGAPDDPQAAVMAGLLLGSPEFQRR